MKGKMKMIILGVKNSELENTCQDAKRQIEELEKKIIEIVEESSPMMNRGKILYDDIAQGKTVHVLKFDVRGLNLLDGEFRIVASFKISSKSVHYRFLDVFRFFRFLEKSRFDGIAFVCL